MDLNRANPADCSSGRSWRRLGLALLASVLVHGGLGWSLGWLPGSTAAPTPPPRAILYVVCSLPAEPEGDKLAPAANPPGPPGVEFVVPTVSNAGIPGGPVLSGVGGDPAGGPGHKGGSGPARPGLFSAPAPGQTVVYVIDRSASMGLHGALATARRELLASVERLPATARFQVIAYNNAPVPLVGRWQDVVAATPENVARVAAAPELQEPLGGTRHLPALHLALTLHPDVIWFLTDADDNDLSEADLRRTVQLARQTVINTVELSTQNKGHGDMPMQRLARLTGGTYQAIDLMNNR
jgi:hypothetical protein